MKDKHESFNRRWKTVGLLLLGLFIGAAIAHIIWFVAVQGIFESDVRVALLTGTDVTGNITSLERYEDGYLAVVETVDYGSISVKLSVEEKEGLGVGSAVSLSCDLTLKQYDE